METEIQVSNFEKSDSLNELATALSLFQGEVENAKKESENPFFHSKYSNLGNIVDVIRKPLSKNGLAICQIPVGEGELISILMHKSGQFIKGTFHMKPKDQSPQSIGSVITYMRRYTLGSMTGVASEEDDDGNAASSNDKKKPFTKPATKEEEEFMNDLQPTDEEIILSQERLESSKNMKELKEVWATLTPLVQEKLKKIKDDLKFKLI